MSDVSWSQRIARPIVRPLVRTPVTPNHLTTLRLLTGIGAAGAFAAGEPAWTAAAGLLFVLSTFLDSADGELARLAGKCSRNGDRYDVVCDIGSNSLIFLGIGLGQRSGMFGGWAIAMGVAAALGILAIYVAMTLIETIEGDEEPVLPGAMGFSMDESLYLIGPIAWLALLDPLLAAASLGAPAAAALLFLRYRRIRARARPARGGASASDVPPRRAEPSASPAFSSLPRAQQRSAHCGLAKRAGD